MTIDSFLDDREAMTAESLAASLRRKHGDDALRIAQIRQAEIEQEHRKILDVYEGAVAILGGHTI